MHPEPVLVTSAPPAMAAPVAAPGAAPSSPSAWFCCCVVRPQHLAKALGPSLRPRLAAPALLGVGAANVRPRRPAAGDPPAGGGDWRSLAIVHSDVPWAGTWPAAGRQPVPPAAPP